MIWDITERKPIVVAITNSQTISDLTISPADPYKLAIGGGDSSVKIWKFASQQNSYDISLYYKGLKTKISSVSILINIICYFFIKLYLFILYHVYLLLLRKVKISSN
jgi:WD40 repeat protein